MAAENMDSFNSSRDSSLDENGKETEGYDNEFIPPEHSHECPICMMCLRDPHQTECGHRFCKNCIKRWLKSNAQVKKCPACNEVLTTSQIYPDNFAKREVNMLIAKCVYSKKGCTEQDNLKSILDHQRDCGFRRFHCPNQCHEVVLYKDSEEHVSRSCPKSTIKCQVCHHQVARCNLEKHRSTCAAAANSCPNCGEPLDSSDEPGSFHACNMNPIKCRFSRFGCNYQCPSTEMRRHMDECQQEHLLCLANAVDRVMTEPLQYMPDIKEIDRRIKSLATHDPGASASLPDAGRADINSDEDDDLKKPVLHRTRSLNTDKGKASGKTVFRSGEYLVTDEGETTHQLRNQLANQQQHILELRSKVTYLENSLQEVKTELRETKTDFRNRSCQGNFIWRLRNYKKLRNEAKHGAPNCVIHSPGFYTSFNGYQFCIRLNLNGVENAQGTHLSLFIHLMQSENDDILSWPFTGKITLSICDQNQQASKRNPITETLIAKPGLAAFQRPNTFRNHKGFGYMEFAPISYLENLDKCFIKDDTLVIRAEVRPS